MQSFGQIRPCKHLVHTCQWGKEAQSVPIFCSPCVVRLSELRCPPPKEARAHALRAKERVIQDRDLLQVRRRKQDIKIERLRRCIKLELRCRFHDPPEILILRSEGGVPPLLYAKTLRHVTLARPVPSSPAVSHGGPLTSRGPALPPPPAPRARARYARRRPFARTPMAEAARLEVASILRSSKTAGTLAAMALVALADVATSLAMAAHARQARPLATASLARAVLFPALALAAASAGAADDGEAGGDGDAGANAEKEEEERRHCTHGKGRSKQARVVPRRWFDPPPAARCRTAVAATGPSACRTPRSAP